MKDKISLNNIKVKTIITDNMPDTKTSSNSSKVDIDPKGT